MPAGWLTVSGRSADVDCGLSSANISRRTVPGRDLPGVVGLAAGLAPSCRGLCVPAKCLAATTMPMQATYGIPVTSVDNERTSCSVDCDKDVRSRSCRCFRRSTAESICLRYRHPPSWPSNTACGIWDAIRGSREPLAMRLSDGPAGLTEAELSCKTTRRTSKHDFSGAELPSSFR